MNIKPVVLTREQIQTLLERYEVDPARQRVLLPPEPPFGTRYLVETDVDQETPSEAGTRAVIAFHDAAEAVRIAHLPDDITTLCDIALAVYELLEENRG